MKRERAIIRKIALENYCWYCHQRSRFGIAIFPDGSELPICQKCSVSHIRRIKNRKTTSRSQSEGSQSILTEFHTGKFQEIGIVGVGQ